MESVDLTLENPKASFTVGREKAQTPGQNAGLSTTAKRLPECPRNHRRAGANCSFTVAWALPALQRRPDSLLLVCALSSRSSSAFFLTASALNTSPSFRFSSSCSRTISRCRWPRLGGADAWEALWAWPHRSGRPSGGGVRLYGCSRRAGAARVHQPAVHQPSV